MKEFLHKQAKRWPCKWRAITN